MIRTLLFDLGNVLLRFSHEKMFGELSALCGPTPAELLAFFMESGVYVGLETGTMEFSHAHAHLEKETARTIDVPALLRAGADIFEPIEEMAAVVAAAKAAGYRLVLISNTCRWHIDWVREQFQVLEPFDELILSYEVGAAKPDVPIFAAALDAIHCEPSECIYTDDIPEYVERGRLFGLNGIVFQNANQWLHDAARFGVMLEGLPAGATDGHG